jgi:diacylglycerol kinase family enzyme
MGLIPAGIGNLLARNLDLPLDEPASIETAFGGRTRSIDLIKATVDDGKPEHFTVMAGIGIDAVIMDETDDALKDKIGAAAYFVAAGKAVGRLPLRVSIQLDDHRPVKRHAMLCVIGNVSDLRGNLTLIPGAKPDDGLLDLYIASPHRFRHWLKLDLRLVTRRPKKDDQVDQHTGKRVTIRIDGGDNYQLDGDVIDKCTTLVAQVEPDALTICVPRPATSKIGCSDRSTATGQPNVTQELLGVAQKAWGADRGRNRPTARWLRKTNKHGDSSPGWPPGC